jgi:hypothetical protein
MAREPDKSAREIGKAKSEATAGSRSGGSDETAEAKSGSSDTAELLKAQHRDLQATLAKRSDVNADRTAIVRNSLRRGCRTARSNKRSLFLR